MSESGSSVRFEIVRAEVADLPAIASIERENSVNASRPSESEATPWSEAMFAEELSQPHARVDVCRTLPDREVIAFCSYWIVADEVHLLRIVTDPGARRRGHAWRLMEHLVGQTRARGCRVILLEVRRSNEAAVSLYRRCGFHTVGVRPAYYADNQEDALLMNLPIDGSG